MPLFPSMYGQLNAIAREYNFPSTAGLCLYLHINENGVKMTPRISDDSWHCLFGHLFDRDGRSPSVGQQLPIGGSIEFDIDLDKARWFDPWISGSLRSSDPVYPPSRPSLDHWRGESQTTHVDEQPREDHWAASQSLTLANNSRPETLRHLPKKLSLVDRLDSHGIHKPQDHHNYTDSSLTHGTYASSPILQPAVPKATGTDLDHRVNSWRATTELCPVSMTETYQPTPDVGASAAVTTMDEYALQRNFQQVVSIDDFLWPVPPVRPHSPVVKSRPASTRPSSLHLDRPTNDTVPLTPTTATSWGPPDDDWHSDVSSVTRLPSPDTGERVVEDVAAPRPHPVWEHSFGWRSAMTWKQVYPFSTIQTMAAIRVQLPDSSGFVPQYPNLVIYPAVDPKSSPQSVWGSSFGWERTVTWRMVYPYSMGTIQSVSLIRLPGTGGLQPKYPNICIYPEVYPHFEIYPACSTEEDFLQPVSVILGESNTLLACYPTLVIYPAVYPYLDIYPPVLENATMMRPDQVGTDVYPQDRALYPSIVICPAVYPHFDLYPPALQIIETPNRVDEMAMKGCPSPKYPDTTTHSGLYPYLEIYPPLNTWNRASSVAWGISFGWLTTKTWLQVYPLHSKRLADDHTKSISRSRNGNSAIADRVDREQAVWGSSFGWKTATTWRAVWPTHRSQAPRTAVIKAEPRSTKESHYPNLVIYPAVYPHFDLYPAVAGDFVSTEREKGGSNLRRRRVERWRARTAAQVELTELLANNHIWEADEPLLDLADYAWSPTSRGAGTSPVEPLNTPSISESVHVDRRVQGSVLLTPSTATTWGPQDDDWCSEIDSVERLPSPDLGQRVLDDVENPYILHQPWRMVWPFFRDASRVSSSLEQSVLTPEYPHLVIYPPVPFQSEYRPTSPPQSWVIEPPANPNTYPVFDIYPVVYPYFNIYPNINMRIEVPDVRHDQEEVDVKLATLYPNFEIYLACYPYNLDCIYPRIKTTESAQIPIEAPCGYPSLVIYHPVYPFVIPYPYVSAEISQPLEPEQPPVTSPIEQKSVNVKLPVCYPLLDLYPAGYPRSLDSIYPDDCSVAIKPQHPCIWLRPPVYPFVQPYPSTSDSVHIPEMLDEGGYGSAKAFLALTEGIHPEPVSYPYFNLYPAPTMPMLQDMGHGDLAIPTHTTLRRQRKTHMELHTLVFQSLGKQPAPTWKTHLQLHIEVFRDGVVWTPSGSSMISREPEDISMPDAEQHQPSQDSSTPPPPVMSETPAPPTSSPTRTYSHMRSTSARFSQPVKVMVPRGQRRNSSATPGGSPSGEYKERTRGLQFRPLADRWPKAVPSSHTNASELPSWTPRSSAVRENSVLQRARAFEQLTVTQSSGSKGVQSPLVLPGASR